MNGYLTKLATLSLLVLLPNAGAHALDPGDVAMEQCWKSVVEEARGRMAAEGVMQEDNPRLSQESNAETRVSGKGSADDRPFTYSCIYNIRNGKTYDVRVKPTSGRPGSGSSMNRNVPNWAVGSFSGYNQTTRSNINLTVTPDGQVIAFADGVKVTGKIENNVLKTGIVSYRIFPTRDGFMTQQIGNENNVVNYQRQ
jgi:hypothetical protein